MDWSKIRILTIEEMKNECPGWLSLNEILNHNLTTDETADLYSSELLGLTIFTVVLIVSGISGNAICLIVFLVRFKPSSYRTYVLVLAAIDLTASCTYMPGILLFMMHPINFTWNITCKLVYFVSSFLLNTNHAVLLLIAIERYRRICQPFKSQASREKIKIGFGLAFAVGLVLSWPRLVLMETMSTQIHELNKSTVYCFSKDIYDGKVSASMYEITVNSFTILLSVIIITLYAFVLKSSYKAKRASFQIHYAIYYGNPNRFRYTYKTTITLLLMTSIFLLLYFPYRFLLIVSHLQGATRCLLPHSGGFLMHLFVSFLMLNHVINPFIYGFWDTRFRREIKKMLHKRSITSSDHERGSSLSHHNINCHSPTAADRHFFNQSTRL